MLLRTAVFALVAAFFIGIALPSGTVSANPPPDQWGVKKGPGLPLAEMLSSGGIAALNPSFGPVGDDDEGNGNGKGDEKNDDAIRNVFVNDPCLDPARPAIQRTVQSETEIAVLNSKRSKGRKMVAGYNDSFGFYNNRQGLSGYSYTTDGGRSWIDGGGLPPKVPSGTTAGDRYFGDPVVVVRNATETFWYASIYQSTAGYFTLSVNRGTFQKAPPQNTESRANTRCAGNPAAHGIPDVPEDQKERIIWEPPVEAVAPPFLGAGNADFLDKEWLYVDQNTGTLYMTYTRFSDAGETPIELVRSFDGGLTWTPPTVIVANEDFDFNQATQPFTTPTGRVIVTWIARQFAAAPPFPEIQNRIEVAVSDDDGATFSAPITVAVVNPQREPRGYNRGRLTVLNAPYIFVDRGADDGRFTKEERERPGFGNVYITYFSGKTPLPILPTTGSQADIFLSRSTTNGTTWDAPVKVNDDPGVTTHIFPSVQVNEEGDVFVAWIDRRVDPATNILNDTWGDISQDRGRSFGADTRISSVSTSWFTRADARPNMGDYNSSELINFEKFVTIWADGRFPPPGNATCTAPTPTATCPTGRPFATPDTIFAIFKDDGSD